MDMHWNAHGNIYCNNCLYIGKKIAQDKVLTQSNGMIHKFISHNLWLINYDSYIYTCLVIKTVVSFSNDYIGMSYGFLNLIPPGVAFFTTGAHCYVYYHLFQLRATKNIDRTLEYTMGKLSTYDLNLLHSLRITQRWCVGGTVESLKRLRCKSTEQEISRHCLADERGSKSKSTSR